MIMEQRPAVIKTAELFNQLVNQDDFLKVKVMLRKYDLAKTYCERFSNAPGDPYYSIAPVNFMNLAVSRLKEVVAQGVFENKRQKELAESLLHEYLKYKNNYLKAYNPLNSMKSLLSDKNRV
jgi:hypothetical protein